MPPKTASASRSCCRTLGLRQPPNRTARTEPKAIEKAAALGYPLVVRPSYVLGGRAMEIVHEQRDLERYMREAVKVSHDSPVLLDRFLNDAIECRRGCLCDGQRVFIGGVMEHIEQAGVHSGDSACSLPPYSLSVPLWPSSRRQTAAMARALNVVGLMNVQFAIQQLRDAQGVEHDTIFVLEVNPRASRTVPFVSKATGIQLAKVAARCMVGQSLDAQGIGGEVHPPYFSVKEAVFPFVKFPGVDTILGPEMKSTGEVMGSGQDLRRGLREVAARRRHQAAALGQGVHLGQAERQGACGAGRRRPARWASSWWPPRAPPQPSWRLGLPCQMVNKVTEGRPHIVDMIKNNEIALVSTRSRSGATRLPIRARSVPRRCWPA
jgi:carbamoyl-phosphate synthase large subunit